MSKEQNTCLSCLCTFAWKVLSTQTPFILINAIITENQASGRRLLFEWSWSCDSLSIALCLSSVMRRFTFHHLEVSSSPCQTSHGRPGSFTERGRCFKGDPIGLSFCLKDTSPSNTSCIMFDLLAVCGFLWLTGERKACQKSVLFISAEPWCFVLFFFPKQQVNSQSIKSFGFCFSRYAPSCQGGSMIDSWLELLYCSEPADCTCPSRTISSYTQFRLLPFLRRGFCANRTHCIVGCSELGNCPLFGLCVPVKEKPWL